MAALPPARLNLVVTGDIVVDDYIYEGQREAPTDDDKVGVRDVQQLSGASKCS